MEKSLKRPDFQSLKLSSELLRALKDLRFFQMTAIQAEALPALLSGKDLIGQSKTGSGKTAAFLLPILQRIQISKLQPQALILCPTRELAEQVLKECRKFSKYLPKIHSLGLIGGQAYQPQTESLAKGPQIIVGTPGRVLEHLNSRKLVVALLNILVLDEADRLLEEGFAEEMAAILETLPRERQTILFSATFPEAIEQLSLKYQSSATRIVIDDQTPGTSDIQEYLYAAEKPEKAETLLKLLVRHPSKRSLIFCRTKVAVDQIGRLLEQAKISCEILHADLPQKRRDTAVVQFRSGSIQVLVATDVAARGLDIDKLELVINFDLPASAEIYLHRIGRTGRAGKKGTAVSLITAYEKENLKLPVVLLPLSQV